MTQTGTFHHVLEKLSPHFNREARSQRNEVAHGGNFKVDLQALDYLEDRRELCQIGFHSLYGQPVDELQSNIETTPPPDEEIVRILDRRATLETIHR
jgi:hypothetical protein